MSTLDVQARGKYLFAISTWPADRISNFLSQVSGRGGDKRRFSEMDILVLRGRFISYFCFPAELDDVVTFEFSMLEYASVFYV